MKVIIRWEAIFTPPLHVLILLLANIEWWVIFALCLSDRFSIVFGTG